jgi:hypothetical protein
MKAENMKKRVFTKPLKPCIGGHGRWKLSREQKKLRAIATKMGRKYENGEFWRCHSNHVLVVTIVTNRPENLNL